MLSQNEVQHIARLARITLSENEILQFRQELTSILEYFEILREVDAAVAEPMTRTVPLQNVKRPDVAIPKNAEETKRLLQMAPETTKGYLKVKSILSWKT